ncbi:uncharacterized protein LOC141587949 [Silene latifolia]|uniref:uncharacterized protein LOC141587949 n=1 Tax=Silene latifolia TaxID=37657 RepID=UPI003D782D22
MTGETLNTSSGDKGGSSEFKIDPLSPFYLGSHDIPGIKISNVMLTSNNYEDWSRSIQMSLKSRRKFGFCDGTVPKPTEPKLLEQWELVNCTIVQWLRHTIDESVLTSVPYVEDAATLWKELEDRFAVVDGTTIHALKSDDNCKQQKGMSITEYYGKLKTLWDALAIYEPPFACKCGQCLCDISTKALQRLDNERLHQFFMGLDHSLYGTLRNQQIQLDPLPSLNRGYHAALQAERLLLSAPSHSDTPDIVAYAVPGTSRTPAEWKAIREAEKVERRKLFCSHCNVNGYEFASCFIRLNKFPDWWGSRPRTLADLHKKRGVGSASGVAGSTTGSSVHANYLFAGANVTSSTHSVSSSERLSGMFSTWIIDTGASNHVIGDLSCFTEQCDIPTRPVGLPNGQQVLAPLIGPFLEDDDWSR